MLSDISQTQKDKHSMFSLNCRLQTVRERQRRLKKMGSHRRGKKPVRMGEDRRGWIGQSALYRHTKMPQRNPFCWITNAH